MSRYREIDMNPTRAELLRFAFVLLVGLGGLALVQRYALHHARAAIAFAIAAVVGAIVACIPTLGRWLYVAWMALGVTLGLVTTPIVLAVVYAIGFVPLGFALRLARRDALRRTIDPNAKSYWESDERPRDVGRYFKQY